MKKRTKTAMAVLCVLCLTLFLAACGGGKANPDGAAAKSSQTPLPPAADSTQESLVIGGFPAQEMEKGVFYLEVFTPESDPGDNPSPLESAKILATALAQTEAGVLTENHKLYIALTGLESVRDADAYTFAVSAGEEFDPQDYADLYCAVDYGGKVYVMPDGGESEWTPLEPGTEEVGGAGLEIETGVYFADENPDDNPAAYDSAAFAWERMKENGNPSGTTNRNIIFRLTGTEFIEGFDHYVYSVELDYGDGPVPLFRIAAYKSEPVLCDAGGNGWEPLGYGDMFGGQKAYF